MKISWRLKIIDILLYKLTYYGFSVSNTISSIILILVTIGNMCQYKYDLINVANWIR